MLDRRTLTKSLAFGMAAMIARIASAEETLDTIPDGPLREQVTWLIGVLDDPEASVTEDDVLERFHESFLDVVSADQMIKIFQELREQLRGVTITGLEVGPSGTDALVGIVGGTGLTLRMTVVVEPRSGLIGGLLFEPGELAPADAAGEPAVAASPAASVIAASIPPPMTDEILAGYQAAVEGLLAVGREATGALLAGDDEIFRGMLSDTAAGVLGGISLDEMMADLTTDIVSFSLAEAHIYFAGRFTGDGIAGFYHQGTPAAFQLAAEDPQTGDVPTGRWTGDIIIGTYRLGIEVTFFGTTGDLSATMSIPEQLLFDHPLSDVRFDAERPLGALVDERALPMGPSMGTSSYGALHEWGDVYLAINSAFDTDTRLQAMSPVMQVPLPPDPAADVTVTTTFRLPFDGAWVVIWGGESEFLNYHSPVPQQRFAHDIVIWRDGATYTGDGTRNEDYHCYAQPQYAPAAGTVVAAEDGYPESTPGPVLVLDEPTHPAGNHIVIKVAENEYVLMAHFIPGSIAVAEGDTVAIGDLVGLTGNSGSSTEPHIHIHMQTGPNMLDPATVGLPMVFENMIVDGEAIDAATVVQGQVIERAVT